MYCVYAHIHGYIMCVCVCVCVCVCACVRARVRVCLSMCLSELVHIKLVGVVVQVQRITMNMLRHVRTCICIHVWLEVKECCVDTTNI